MRCIFIFHIHHDSVRLHLKLYTCINVHVSKYVSHASHGSRLTRLVQFFHSCSFSLRSPPSLITCAQTSTYMHAYKGERNFTCQITPTYIRHVYTLTSRVECHDGVSNIDIGISLQEKTTPLKLSVVISQRGIV